MPRKIKLPRVPPTPSDYFDLTQEEPADWTSSDKVKIDIKKPLGFFAKPLNVISVFRRQGTTAVPYVHGYHEVSKQKKLFQAICYGWITNFVAYKKHSL